MLDRTTISEAPAPVSAALAAAGLVPAGRRWRAMRGGRTNRLWRVGEGPGALVCKLYRHDAATPLFPNDPAAEAQALAALAGTGIAPELVGAAETPAGYCIVYRHVPGRTWRPGLEAAAAAGDLLARLHRLPPPGALRQVATEPESIMREAAPLLAALPPGPARRLARLRPTTPPAGEAPPAFLHGDPVAGNLVDAPAGLRLIDWQCPARGPAAADLAIFLSPAMNRLYAGRPLSEAERAAFLAGYAEPQAIRHYEGLAPLLHWRIAVFCHWKAARGAAGYAEAAELELEG